ncbi:hypothetical protein JW711_00830 [Candidatus Woesearchaeota archaeon]|nr:hypothetical protein [Candidatus Woesearchaeota archaeon]
MIDILLVVSGIITICIAIGMNISLLKITEDTKLKKKWIWLLGLVIFFLFGYIAFLINRIIPKILCSGGLLVGSIFFFGAIFVLVVMEISTQMIKKLQSKNRELTDVTRALMKANQNLVETENELQLKNEQLKGTLEDFYTVRVKMEKGKNKQKIKRENEDIRKKINRIK